MYRGWMTTYTPSCWVVGGFLHGKCNGGQGSTKVDGRRGLLQLNSLFYKVHTCTVQCLTQCAWRSSQLGRELRNGLRAYQIGKWLMLSTIGNRILIEARINRSQNQHMLSTTISIATKANTGLGTRRSGTSSRILVIIQIFCRSINTPSSRPTPHHFWMQ